MNYKIHFGKNISFKSNLIELLTSENIKNNLIYVKNNHLSLLAPGLHNQYLSYDNGKYTWKFMEGDFDQGVWTVSLYSTDFLLQMVMVRQLITIQVRNLHILNICLCHI